MTATRGSSNLLFGTSQTRLWPLSHEVCYILVLLAALGYISPHHAGALSWPAPPRLSLAVCPNVEVHFHELA